MAPKNFIRFHDARNTVYPCAKFGVDPIDPKIQANLLNFWHILDFCPPKNLRGGVLQVRGGLVRYRHILSKDQVLAQGPLSSEIRSFEKFYIGWVKTTSTVNNFLLVNQNT